MTQQLRTPIDLGKLSFAALGWYLRGWEEGFLAGAQQATDEFYAPIEAEAMENVARYAGHDSWADRHPQFPASPPHDRDEMIRRARASWGIAEEVAA